jgi:expansin (peptidoglycan-binding protein)
MGETHGSMATKCWPRRGSRLLFAAISLWPLACASGDPIDPEENGGSSNGSAGRPGTGGSTGGTTSGAGRGGSAGTATGGTTMNAGGASGVGGAAMSSGGAAMSVGGAAMGVGGSIGPTGGMPGVGGAVSGSAGVPPATGGVGPVAGSGGDAPMAGTGPVDPCATVTCGADQTCMNGTCMCNMGMLCSNACVDTQADANNCGACGMKCATGGACVDGKCVNPMCNPDTQVRNGHVTHYTLATSMVACHYPTSTLPQYYGAMNEYDWNNAGVCGSCVEITNGGKKLVVQITDQCPYKGNEQWCFQGSHHIDLNNAANDALGAGSNPAVTWKYVACTTQGNMKYYFDQASQQYYLAVTPMNHLNPVAKMEVKKGGAYSPLTRTTYNMFELKDGAGTGMLTFRITDIYNHVLVDTVSMTPGQAVQGGAQFPACP